MKKTLDEIKIGDLVNGHQLSELLKDGGYRVLVLYRGERYILDNIPLTPELGKKLFITNLIYKSRLFIRMQNNGITDLDNLNDWPWFAYYRTSVGIEQLDSEHGFHHYDEYLETNETFWIFIKPV